MLRRVDWYLPTFIEKSYCLNVQCLQIHLLFFLFVHLIRKTNQRQVPIGQFDINFCLLSKCFYKTFAIYMVQVNKGLKRDYIFRWMEVRIDT